MRGSRLADVRDRQLPAALALDPDLVSVMAGVNDVLRPGFDLDVALGHVDAMQRELRDRGITVLTSTFPDLSPASPLARLVRGRMTRLNAGLREIAARRGTILADLANSPIVADPRPLLCEDRLHLNPEGHRRLATAIAQAISVAAEAGHPDLPAAPSLGRGARAAAELRWARHWLVPWIGRRLTGRSSGDGIVAKRPRLEPVSPARTD